MSNPSERMQFVKLQAQEQQKSKGHIGWDKYGYEWYEAGGEVYRAKSSNVISTDGYRFGRWECSKEHFDRFRKTLRDMYGI